MSKWLIWALLELSTLLVLGNLLFLWLSYSLNKKIQQKQNVDLIITNETHSSAPADDSKFYKKLAHYLDLQIQFTANAIVPGKVNTHEINRLKIWGTILRAERAILLNQVSERPKPILNRFLSSLLYALSAPKLQTTHIEELHQNLKEMEGEFFQTAELLISKESLTKRQFLLNEDLRKNVDRAKNRVRQLDMKKAEQQRLEMEIENLQEKIRHLEEHQTETPTNFSNFNWQVPTAKKLEKQIRNASFKQISSLNGLSDRQKMVIDQLKGEIEKAYKSNNSYNAVEAQKVAIAKMERMSAESQTLIFQLEAELKTSNLSITSLRQDISVKDAKLAEIERQLASSNETAIGNLQALNANKKETLVSLRDGLNTALENRSTDSLIEQEKDTKMLERLLQESETCVTLLAQELDIAEETNLQLKQKVEALALSENTVTSKISKPLFEQREKNRQLVLITTELKKKVMNMMSSKDYQSLRATYNKKSLECDRLQLAFSDLEMKYLGTLNE
jgi:chromosome segregation ATPase